MPLLEVRKFTDCILELPDAEDGLERWNHVFEPEYHQERYVSACRDAEDAKGAFQLQDGDIVQFLPYRGIQPIYADDEGDLDTLNFEGQIKSDGTIIDRSKGKNNICALKSVSIRSGYIDFTSARSVSRAFYTGRGSRARVQRNDVLINSTGDGTIGRVAVFDEDFPAVVDGHITIVRFQDPDLAWYTAGYLLTSSGQNQIYRYINGSSGQVEIYPQDIARLWIPPRSEKTIAKIANGIREAARSHKQFYINLRSALSSITGS